MKRIIMMLMLAALLVAALTITAGTGFAKQAKDFNETSPGTYTVHHGNSTNSAIDTQCHGSTGQGSCY